MTTVVEDFGSLNWLWQDATLLALQVTFLPDGYLTITVRCEANAYEDPSFLIPFGAAARVMDVILHQADDFSVWNLATTGDPEVIVDWDVATESGEHPGPRTKHVIRLHTGAVIEMRCKQIEIAQVG